MKKLLLCVIALCAVSQISYADDDICNISCEHVCDCKANSHTFFSIRPVFTINSPEYLAHNRDFYKAVCNGWGGTIQATVLGGKSTHNDDIARFFLPFCKDTIVISEEQLPETDVLAQNLNIYTKNGNFQSTLKFKPRHSFIGLGINYQQRIYQLCNGHSIWFSISGPILRVRNRIKLFENIINDGGGALGSPDIKPVVPSCHECLFDCDNEVCDVDPNVALSPVDSAVAAFAQPGWCFGRIDNNCKKCQTVTKIGDVTARLGYETMYSDCGHLDSFIGVIIPTGNRPHGVNVFEPIVGHNHHWGIVLGSTFGIEIWHNACGDLNLASEFDFSVSTFFSRKERRSFDLKYKPWSRYMQFYLDVDQALLAADSVDTDPDFAFTLHTPGINLLTRDIDVHPGYYRMFNVAFILDSPCFELEVGYNFFARQAECLRLSDPFIATAAIKDVSVGAGQTTRVATINNTFDTVCTSTSVDNFEDNIITAADIDLDSAAHPATLSHTVYGSLAYQWTSVCNNPVYLAVGGSYEFPPDNVGLNRWMAWGKIGIAF